MIIVALADFILNNSKKKTKKQVVYLVDANDVTWTTAK